MNRRGDSKLLTFWWFVVMIFIALGIVIGVGMFASKEIFVKKAEAEVLSDRLSRCVLDNYGLIDDFISDNFDVYKKCNLEKKMFDNGGLFSFKITLFNNQNNLVKEYLGGDMSLFGACVVTSIEGANVYSDKYPVCFERNLSVSYSNGKEGRIEVKSVSNQVGTLIGGANGK